MHELFIGLFLEDLVIKAGRCLARHQLRLFQCSSDFVLAAHTL